VGFSDELHGFAVGAGGLIIRTTDGGLSWSDVESPVSVNLFAVAVAGPDEAIATGELGTVIVTNDGGNTWRQQPVNTTRLIQSIVYRGGSSLWIAGRGGAILKRLSPLSPLRIKTPLVPPILKAAEPKRRLQPRIPSLAVPAAESDLPTAIPQKKDN
ncbi:YCF48-related protein, partial [Escherichia coli]|nr:YCF48-related protein [Escherichia coli]